jgi:hypothetical protein
LFRLVEVARPKPEGEEFSPGLLLGQKTAKLTLEASVSRHSFPTARGRARMGGESKRFPKELKDSMAAGDRGSNVGGVLFGRSALSSAEMA